MDIKEIKKRLNEFAEFLDNEEPSLKKGQIGRFFTGYIQLFNKYCFLQYKVSCLDKEVNYYREKYKGEL